jgi:hypothetical protein
VGLSIDPRSRVLFRNYLEFVVDDESPLQVWSAEARIVRNCGSLLLALREIEAYVDSLLFHTPDLRNGELSLAAVRYVAK